MTIRMENAKAALLSVYRQHRSSMSLMELAALPEFANANKEWHAACDEVGLHTNHHERRFDLSGAPARRQSAARKASREFSALKAKIRGDW